MNPELRHKLAVALSPYIPEKAMPVVVAWIDDYRIKVVITPGRKTRYADYRHPNFKRGHVISINRNLNPFSFLVSFVHEVAHLTTWLSHKNRVQPHGTEWKQEYKRLMYMVSGTDVFPHELRCSIEKSLNNPSASTCSDVELTKVLSGYNHKSVTHLDQLHEGDIFLINQKEKFVKGKRRRKWFECRNIENGKIYFISPVAEVTLC